MKITENSTGSWADSQKWRISPEARLSIGETAGEPGYLLYSVSAATRLPGGGIVVANEASELRYFDGEGRYLYTRGGPGDGPQEFRYITLVAPYLGDSILVSDGPAGRASIWDKNGKWGRTIILPKPTEAQVGRSNYGIRGAFADGTFLYEGGWLRREIDRQHPDWLLAPFSRISRDGGEVEFLANLSAGPLMTVAGSSIDYVLFGGYVRDVPVFREHFYHGTGATYDVSVFGLDGSLSAKFRRHVMPLTVTDDDLAREREQAILSTCGDDDECRVRMQASSYEAYAAKAFPAFRGLKIDPDGNLWVEEGRRERHGWWGNPEDDNPVHWTVFQSSGEMLGTIETPSRMWVFEFGRDYVLGVVRDSLDVERIQVFELFKPPQ